MIEARHLEIVALSKCVGLETFLLLLLTSESVALIEIAHGATLHGVRLHTSLHGIWLHSETLIAHLEALHLPEHGLERLFLLILGLRLSEASKVVLVLNNTFSDHAIERGVLVIGRVRV